MRRAAVGQVVCVGFTARGDGRAGCQAAGREGSSDFRRGADRVSAHEAMNMDCSVGEGPRSGKRRLGSRANFIARCHWDART